MSKKINICVLGNKMVGKSSTIFTFVNSYFDEDKYSPTIENKHTKLFTHKKQLYSLNIHDTAGSKEFETLIVDTIKQCTSFIIMYSVTDRNSYDSIYKYRELIRNTFPYKKYIPIILVANKTDCNELISFSNTEIVDISKSFDQPSAISSSKDLNLVVSLFKLLLDTNESIEKQIKKDKSKQKKIKQPKTSSSSSDKDKENKDISTESLQYYSTSSSSSKNQKKHIKHLFKIVMLNLKHHKLLNKYLNS